MKLLIGIMSLLFAISTFANDKPSFDNGILTIPSVDSEGVLGLYQNVVFEFSEQKKWELRDVKIGRQIETHTQIDNSGALEILFGIQSVEIIKIDSFPIQILLKIAGAFTSGCQDIGQINHQFKDNKFNVFVFHSNEDKYADMSCAAALQPFAKIVPLPVYGLKSGEYEVSVNGLFLLTFSFEMDNEI